MKNKFFPAVLVIILAICGCSKTPDNGAEWAGTYKSANATGVNMVTIKEVDPATVNIVLYGGGGAVASQPLAKLQTSYTVAITWSGFVPGDSTTQYTATTGTLTTKGDSLVITGQARNLVTDSVTKVIFYGGK